MSNWNQSRVHQIHCVRERTKGCPRLAPRQSNHRVLLQNLWARRSPKEQKSDQRWIFWVGRGSGWRGRDFIDFIGQAAAKGGVTTALGKQTQIALRPSHDLLNSRYLWGIIFQLEHWNQVLSTGLCLTWLEWKWKAVVTLSVPHLFGLFRSHDSFLIIHIESLIIDTSGGCQLSGRFHSRTFSQVPLSVQSGIDAWPEPITNHSHSCESYTPRKTENQCKECFIFMVMFQPEWMTREWLLNDSWSQPSSALDGFARSLLFHASLMNWGAMAPG